MDTDMEMNLDKDMDSDTDMDPSRETDMYPGRDMDMERIFFNCSLFHDYTYHNTVIASYHIIMTL